MAAETPFCTPFPAGFEYNRRWATVSPNDVDYPDPFRQGPQLDGTVFHSDRRVRGFGNVQDPLNEDRFNEEAQRMLSERRTKEDAAKLKDMVNRKSA